MNKRTEALRERFASFLDPERHGEYQSARERADLLLMFCKEAGLYFVDFEHYDIDQRWVPIKTEAIDI